MGGKPGRGSENKVAFVAAVQTTASGQAVVMCLSRRPFTKQSIEDFAAKSLVAPATLITDVLACFTAVRGMGFRHDQHITGGGACKLGCPTAKKVIEPLFSFRTSVSIRRKPYAAVSIRLRTCPSATLPTESLECPHCLPCAFPSVAS